MVRHKPIHWFVNAALFRSNESAVFAVIKGATVECLHHERAKMSVNERRRPAHLKTTRRLPGKHSIVQYTPNESFCQLSQVFDGLEWANDYVLTCRLIYAGDEFG